VRTIERDISALQQSGVPIWAEPGRTGGYCISPEHTLPPVNFTPQEAMAMAVALQSMGTAPFRSAAQTAMRKLVFAMRADDARSARRLASRIHFLRDGPAAQGAPRLLADALVDPHVLRIVYGDRSGARTEREIEPLGYVIADLVERAAAAGASLALDIDHLLDTFQVRRQRAAVGLAWPSTAGLAGIALHGCLSLCQCGLDLLEAKLELVGIELLRSATKTMALQSINNGLQPLYFSPRRLQRVYLARLLDDECAERIYVIGEIRFGEHVLIESGAGGLVNRRSAALAGACRHVPGASPNPRAKRQAGPR
jgi:hypothetical protein